MDGSSLPEQPTRFDEFGRLEVAEFVRILTQANAVTKFQGHLEVGSGGTLTRFRYKMGERRGYLAP